MGCAQSKPTSEDLAFDLLCAVRDGHDLKAIESLLVKGASPNMLVPMAWFDDWKEPEVEKEVTSISPKYELIAHVYHICKTDYSRHSVNRFHNQTQARMRDVRNRGTVGDK